MPFFLSLDHSYRLTSHKNSFFPPRVSQAGCGALEWAIPMLAWAVCTRSVARTKPTKPNWIKTSPARSHTPNETKRLKRCPEIKAEWQECAKKMVKWYPEIKSQMSLWTKKDVQLESWELSFIWGKWGLKPGRQYLRYQYIRFWWRGSSIPWSTHFTKGFLLSMRIWCHHEVV